MHAKSEAASKYSKTVDVEEDPNDFDDIVTKQTEISKNCADWKNEGCGICKFPRSEHQRFTQKHRLCKPILVYLIFRFTVSEY